MSRDLPITDRRDARTPLGPEREEEIAHLVSTFYSTIRTDPILGPIFDNAIKDWDTHLAKMNDFWNSAIYKAGRYSGSPLQVHQQLASLEQHHFQRWLQLWERTVEETVQTEIKDDLIEFARRMARSMSSRLHQADGTPASRN